MPPLPHPRWLLLSDIHFRPRDLERTRKTAEWIVSLARETPGISRVVICGDVLTSRSMQPTAVISAAYRFLSDLSSSVPHLNVVLGNHDLAYRRDYRTTALEALNMSRLRPFISLHDDVGRYNWDGRDVLVLPFREDQAELTAAVADLDPAEAARTVAFAHLAINRAVTQRHVVNADGVGAGSSVRYRGLTGPDHFSSLARTFTGHFHSHQVILQPNQPASQTEEEDRLQGSVAYLGAPLQMTWADLCDEDRGVVLLDPATLKHELIVNPHAIGYIIVQGSEVLDDSIEASTVQDKHVMMLGTLTRFQYLTARDKLLSLGAQSVREPRPTPTLQGGSESSAYQGLGTSVPESDRGVALQSAENEEPSLETADEQNDQSESDKLESVKVDLVEYVPGFVRSVAAESVSQAKLIELGQRLVVASESTASVDEEAAYKILLNPSQSIATEASSQVPTRQVFVARPRSLVISNFLGIQGECTIDFNGEMGRGLSFVVGSNGSGKSTLVEAIVWCQFGRCIRKGLSVGDVVNDVAGQDCMVSLSFSNGYTITRYRKHKTHGNRVIVSLHGVDQPQFEHGESRASQAALDELLGIDYEEFIKAVVLGHESAASFLSSTPAQRQDFIESTLGLSTLDKSADLARKMLREVDSDTDTLRSKINTIEQARSLIEDRMNNRKKELRRLRKEEEDARKSIESKSGQSEMNDDAKGHQVRHASDEDMKALSTRLEELKAKIKESQRTVNQAQSVLKDVEAREVVVTRKPAPVQRTTQETKDDYRVMRDELLMFKEKQRDQPAMEHINSFESTVGHLLQAITWLQTHIFKTVDFSNRQNRPTLHFIRIGLMSLERLSNHFSSHLGQLRSSISKQQQQYEEATDSILKKLETKLTEGEPIKARDTNKTELTPDKGVSEQAVSSPSDNIPKITSQEARQHLSTSFSQLSDLLEEQGALHKRQAQHQREIAKINESARERTALLNKLAGVEREIAIYQKLIEEETSMLEEQSSAHASSSAEAESLMSTRELFAFWEESLSRRRTKSATAATFRGYVLDKSLHDLNAVASNILSILYENTRHARELTGGMLRTILSEDSGAGLLDQTLGVSKTLSYAKRSGGERKRIDLAVFFALVQIQQAHSRHRARYILIDEAFDSLDAAGQAAVVRWCSTLMARTDFQLVVTHSDYLISSARSLSGSAEDNGGDSSADGDDGDSRFSVLSATMTKEGTKFSYSMP
ncbi:P-loop containing nucleoside triphosphate hydrolase protein [Xylaria venustula]|nr:P-loop containing nucleoside triphosphate hydrolase protein [Xylaria venustula]